MIVALHVATGAAAGAVVRSRPAAVAVGLALHLAGDVMPHQDIRSHRFETLSGIAALLFLAVRRGPFAPETLGALASSCPDIEHSLPLPRPGGRKLFPSHRISGLHRVGGVPAWAQVLAAGILLGAVTAR